MDHRQQAADSLEQAVASKNTEWATALIDYIISNRIQVKISPLKFQCSSHIFMFPGMPSFFLENPNNYHVPYHCANSHKICNDCLINFITWQFGMSGLGKYYECPACAGHRIPGSILYHPDLEEKKVASYVGEDAVNADKWSRATHAQCNNFCNNISSQAYSVCADNHIFCEVCIQNAIEAAKFSLKCPNKNCKRIMASWIAEQACFEKKDLLKKIWEDLKIEGFLFNLCPNCDARIKTPTASAEIKCTECGKKYCIDCLEESHIGISCLAASEDQAKVVDLPVPADFSKPKNKLEREYLNAKFVFEQNARDKVMVSAKMIINKAVEMRYKAKKEEISKTLADREDDIYVWHGSSAAAYDNIAKNGFGIGGVTPGVAVKTNTAFGYGVYTATDPQLSFSYVVGDTILCCKAFKGNLGNNTVAANPADLNNPNQHAYLKLPEGILVLFSTDQIVPVYLIKYRNA
ncbi:unnamed protein product [Blepharisma stoltei]|uniref:IBR domain-containing protein n=1 Tax=Blepharisma stoltei TaxID=1481888 RepID=A0AAU9JGU0_9CILI|nr:unnamed protein product [Blepharisma stoltei]